MSPFLGQMNEYIGLLQTFFEAVDALHQQDISRAEALFHDDIVLNKIYDKLATVRGKKDVVHYLQQKVKKDQPVLKPISPILVDIRVGTVSGLAMWQDNKAGGINEMVDYSFAFTLTSQGWRINNMHAS